MLSKCKMSVRPCYFTTSPQLPLVTPSNVKTSWDNKWSFFYTLNSAHSYHQSRIGMHRDRCYVDVLCSCCHSVCDDGCSCFFWTNGVVTYSTHCNQWEQALQAKCCTDTGRVLNCNNVSVSMGSSMMSVNVTIMEFLWMVGLINSQLRDV